MRKASFLTALLLLAPVASQAKTLEELLVDKGVITKGEAAGTSAMTNSGGKVYYNEGTRIEFPDAGFSTKIQTLIQTRYSFTDSDEDAPQSFGDYPATYNGHSGRRENRSSFDVHRARLIVSGTALHQEFAYRLEADFVGTSNDGGASSQYAKSPDLKDAYIAWQPCQEYTTKLGQFHVLVSRQNQSDVGKLLLPDASIVTQGFAFARQQGIAQWADLADGKFQVAGGIYNGTTDGEGLNSSGADTDHLGVVAVRYNAMGKMDVYEESDVNGTEDAALSIGAAYLHGEAHNVVVSGSAQEDTELDMVNADINFKSNGLSVQGEYFWAMPDLQHRDFDAAEPQGGYVQVGYFLKPKAWELAGRYGFIDCDNGAASGMCSGLDNINEATGGINYYWWKHQLKAQFAYSLINEDQTGADGDDFNTNKWTFQLSGYF